MAPNATWNELIRIVRGLTDRENGPPVKGSFTISNQMDLAAIQTCLDSESDTHLHLISPDEQTSLRVGQIVKIEVSPRFGFGLLTPNVDSLLNAQYARVKEPSRYFLLEESIDGSAPVPDDHLLARYRKVLEFIQTLKHAAAFLDPDEPALIFINDGKYELPINYTESDLVNLSLLDLNDLVNILPTGTHKKDCAAILEEAVIDMTMHLSTQDRFRYLLAHLKELKKRYEDGYKIFASGFSYEKVRDQVEAARVEYTGKIHKVFSDIQNQLLSIPVATIIVATQMKAAKDFGYEFWVNSSVLIGCWVFAILMIFLLHNQSTTLGVLRDEINRQKRQLKKDFSLIAESFSDTFKYLSRRALTQRIIIWVIDLFVVFGLILSHVIYFKVTQPVRDWIVSVTPFLAQYL
jgi:hypothetical protein